ncbi:K02A2.6-like [Cordylochernes scorpioides]|uniref:K02A2.6-like n=1 Tax=Cordylochernes scorpioides TaxID=51811 RepID=A0ABY6LRX6_9ARAC|nr:K02A2.6-like [Cordylochernes scorpioides]
MKISTSRSPIFRHEDAFEKICILAIKTLLRTHTAPTLKFFNLNGDLTLSVDASSYALGAPIVYASALNSTQQIYAQIEKEVLAIKFGYRQFYQFIYGKSVDVETDHRYRSFFYGFRRARDSIYWHDMSQDITNTVENCRTFQANQRNKTKEPIMIKDISNIPWEIVLVAYIFSSKGKFTI